MQRDGGDGQPLRIRDLLLFILTPFSIISLALWACVRTVTLATQLWWELLMAVIGFCLHLCSKFIVWELAILTLPLRLFIALYREIKLEEQLREMKARLENLASENKELEQCLLLAVKETNIAEKALQGIEDDYEKAIAKISLLESEIQDQKEQGKDIWDWKSSSEMRGGVPSWSGDRKEGGVVVQDVMVRRQQGGDDGERRFLKGEESSSAEEQKAIAFRGSFFSAALSLLVGLIVWEAEDPCMPLVAALFTVVCMSLGNVVRFFLTIQNKPASDAVLLLSINCFMLGTLIRPTLPRVLLMWGLRQ